MKDAKSQLSRGGQKRDLHEWAISLGYPYSMSRHAKLTGFDQVGSVSRCHEGRFGAWVCGCRSARILRGVPTGIGWISPEFESLLILQLGAGRSC